MKYSELNERKSHGTVDFPVEYYSVDRSHSQYVMPPHWHTEAEIIRVVKGSFRLSLNRENYELCEGDVAFVSPGVLHHGEPTDCRYECAVFSVDPFSRGAGGQYVKSIATRRCEVTPLFRRGTAQGLEGDVDALFSALSGREEQYELAVFSAIYRIFYDFYRMGAVREAIPGRVQEKQIRYLTELLSWIDEHYAEKITLKDLSTVSGINEKYLCRFFKEYTGSTPLDFVNRLRIGKAAESIRAGRQPITDAAYTHGFNDSGYFSKLFRQTMGCSPSEYRKMQGK